MKSTGSHDRVDQISRARTKRTAEGLFFVTCALATMNLITRNSCLGEEPQKSAEKTDDPAEDLGSVSTEELMKRLVNRNNPPTEFKGAPPKPKFPADYDWKEQARVVDALRELERRIETALPELLKHLDDEQYCTTYADPSDAWSNDKVGTRCYWLAVQHLCPVELHYRPVALRPVPWNYSKAELREWYAKRQKNSLAELQLECLRFQRAQVLKLKVPKRDLRERRNRIEEIDLAIKEIESTGSPIKVEAVVNDGLHFKNYPYPNKRKPNPKVEGQ